MRSIHLYIAVLFLLSFSLLSAHQRANNRAAEKSLSKSTQIQEQEKAPILNRLLGNWGAYQVSKKRDGSWSTDTTYAHWNWYSIMDDNAIQDDWLKVTKNGSGEISEQIAGSTIRIYNPLEKQWHMVWVGLALRRMVSFTAVEENEKVIMSGRNVNGREVRNTFFNISKDSFDWNQEWTFDEGKSWVVVNKIHCVRR